MFNPILGELAARERFKDYVREADQGRLAQAAVPPPARRFDRPISFGSLALVVRCLFKVLARAG